MTTSEQQIELNLITKLGDLKYTYRPDIRHRTALEANFRAKFEALNRVYLTDSEFQRLRDSIVTDDVYNAAQTLRNINSFERDELDFEFVLFASSMIDHDYIMNLIAKLSHQRPGKLTMNREQLIGFIQSDAEFIDEREDIAEYVRGLPVNEALDKKRIRNGFDRFKAKKKAREITEIATRHALDAEALQTFVDDILLHRIFDGESLSELINPLNLGWKACTQKELALMDELTPLLHKLAQGLEMAGLAAYEEER